MRFSLKLLPMILLFIGLQTTYSQTIHSSIKALTEEADLIIAGKVTSQKAEWNETKTMIMTRVTLKVDEYYKGTNRSGELIITHPGGEIGSVGELYSHIPSFDNNEEVLLFLKKYEKDASFRVLEGESGKLSLRLDMQTGEKYTPQNIRLTEMRKEIKSLLDRQ